MKAKVNRKCHVFYAWKAETRLTIKVLFILYFVSDPESESEPESESIRSPESESESEQPHHDSASLVGLMTFRSAQAIVGLWDVGWEEDWAWKNWKSPGWL